MAAAFLAFVSMSASASDGTITFSGSISDASCTIAVNNGGAVTMPPVSATTLASTGATAGGSPITVELTDAGGGKCTGAAKLAFDGGDIDYVTGNLKNTAVTDAASNVQIQLVNADDTAIKLGDQSTVKGSSIVGNKASLQYKAKYISTGAVTAGAVQSTVTYSVAYN